jgi:hypothetical protein
MYHMIRSSLLIAVLTTGVSSAVENQVLAGGRNCCCQTCRQPCGHCNCQAPAAPQTAYQPVVETQYAQQPVLQQRDVVATEYRNETVLETVPATVVENVTVDEGSYQTVWVPRLTTKAVARTTYQTRAACRTVPYQVTRRVSEYATQTVPYQTVRYVPANGTAVGYSSGPQYASTVLPPVYGNGAMVSGTYPTLAVSPNVPSRNSGSVYSGSSIASVPDSRYADSPVTPITPRSASSASRFGNGSTDNRTADRGSSMFVPAPSAAQVWRSTQGSVVR